MVIINLEIYKDDSWYLTTIIKIYGLNIVFC